MKYDFDTVYDRHHTNCAKYDSGHTDDPDLIPMWVADMDFKTLPDIPEALSKRPPSPSRIVVPLSIT